MWCWTVRNRNQQNYLRIVAAQTVEKKCQRSPASETNARLPAVTVIFPTMSPLFLKCPHFFKSPGTLSPVMKFLGRTLLRNRLISICTQKYSLKAWKAKMRSLSWRRGQCWKRPVALWPNTPNCCLGPPEISRFWTSVAQIYLSGNSKWMESSARGHFGPLKFWAN